MENSYLHYKSFFLSQHPQYIDIQTLKCEGIFYRHRFTSLATRVNDGTENSK